MREESQRQQWLLPGRGKGRKGSFLDLLRQLIGGPHSVPPGLGCISREISYPSLAANLLLGTRQRDLRCKLEDGTKSQKGTVSQTLLSLRKDTGGQLARLLCDYKGL